MTSKVLVKMPEVPFSQVKKAPAKQMTTACSCGDTMGVYQLQENIRFLQTKHQIMLSRLHEEVDILRQKNRDLQFQLVFSKNNSSTGETSNAEETTEPKTLTETEPAPTTENSEENEYKKRCSQLEVELASTKATLQTTLTRNAALLTLINKHKIQETAWIKQQCGHSANAVVPGAKSDAENDDSGRLQVRLDEAERLVKRLRAETDEQRRELQSIKASLSAGGRGNGGGGRGGQRIGPLHQRFPPLQSVQQQPFWQQQQNSSQQRDGNDYQGWNRGNRQNGDKVDAGIQGIGINNALPDLRNMNPQGSYNNVGNINRGQNMNQPRRGMGNHGYNNHYFRNSERGHRGDPRSYREDDHHQHKNYNSPGDQSEGEVEESTRNNSYKNKRGQNKHQDKS